jgi:hypothetical protein
LVVDRRGLQKRSARMTRLGCRGGVFATCIAFLVGCGGPSAEDRARAKWESQEGAAWALYEDGYERGWLESCEEFRSLLPEPPEGAGLPILPTCDSPPSSSETNDPPFPPDDPEGEGYKIGRTDGCLRATEPDEESAQDECLPRAP